jgi:hypothetical protein
MARGPVPARRPAELRRRGIVAGAGWKEERAMQWGARSWLKEFERRTGCDARDFLDVASPSGQTTRAAGRRGPRERVSFNACVRRTADAIKQRTDADRHDWIATALALAIAGWFPAGGGMWEDERGLLQFGAPDLDARFTALFDRFRKQVKWAYQRTAPRSAKGIKRPSGRIERPSGRIKHPSGRFRGN